MFDSTGSPIWKQISARGIVLRLTTEQAISADVERGRFEPYKIAVLVPCYNEEATVAKVVEDFRAALPAAEIFVFDNNSTDDTRSVAGAAGAVVFLGDAPRQRLRRAPNVLRRRSRRLRIGRWRRDVRCVERPADGQTIA